MSIKFLSKGKQLEVIPNIFMQMEEPHIKEGIWLQSDKVIEHIIVEDNMHTAPIFMKDKYDIGKPSFTAVGMRSLVVGTDIYITSSPSLLYKLDTVTKTWTKIDMTLMGSSVHMAYKDGYIYMIDAGSLKSPIVYQYSITNNTFEKVTSTGSTAQYLKGSSVTINDDIYIFYTNSTQWYQYNMTSCVFTKMPSLPFTTPLMDSNNPSCTDGYHTIYTIDKNNVMYSYCLDTGVWKELMDFKTLVSEDNITAIDYCTLTYFNGKLYIYVYYEGTDTLDYNAILVYDLTSNIFEILEIDLSSKNYYYKEIFPLFMTVGNELILIGRTCRNCAITIPYKTFEDKSVIINQGTKYGTQIASVSNTIDGRLVNRFDDVWYHTLQTGLDNDMPIYYGNGSEWIKFKN